MKEESSVEGENSESEGDENYKKIKQKREERRIQKHGLDLAKLISRESPRGRKAKRKREQEKIFDQKPQKRGISSRIK